MEFVGLYLPVNQIKQGSKKPSRGIRIVGRLAKRTIISNKI